MMYVKNNKSYTIDEIRQENPNVSFPEGADCTAFGYAFLEETEIPTQDGFYAVEVAPVNNKQTWELKEIEVHVPTSITRLQAKLQLLEIGLLDEVETLISQDKKAQLYWNEANNFLRTDEILLSMAVKIGLSDTQLDDLFLQASKIES